MGTEGETSVAHFAAQVCLNAKGWGPDVADAATIAAGLARIQEYPFEPSMKPDYLGRVCDFTFASYQRTLREGARFGYHIPPGFEEELKFQTVDTRPVPKSRGRYSQRKVMKSTTQAYNQKQLQEKAEQLGRQKRAAQQKFQALQQARYQRMYNRHRTFAEWSVEPTASWTTEAEIPLNQLLKQMVDASKVEAEDLCWRGELRLYNREVDRMSPKVPIALQHLSNALDYYWVTTSEDDVIKEHMMSDRRTIHVAATDQILACLMAAPQSKYSWHVNITKLDDKLIFDKANGSIIDLLTVNETATDPPMQDDTNKLNRPPALGFEAVKINQNFRQQVLDQKEGLAEKWEAAPFVEEGDTPASVAYRYRLFTLPGRPGHATEFGKLPITLLTRAEVNAKMPNVKDGAGGYLTICALNEFDINSRKNWRTQIENQKGALLATEIRNNANKLHKWVASAMIAGCDHLKLGYVSRRAVNDAETHFILSIQSYKVNDLGIQIGLKADNAWGIVRSVVDMLMEKPDGRYVLLKDPIKPILRLYCRPEEEVEDEEVVVTNAATV